MQCGTELCFFSVWPSGLVLVHSRNVACRWLSVFAVFDKNIRELKIDCVQSSVRCTVFQLQTRHILPPDCFCLITTNSLVWRTRKPLSSTRISLTGRQPDQSTTRAISEPSRHARPLAHSHPQLELRMCAGMCTYSSSSTWTSAARV